MLARRTQKILGQILVVLIGPLCLLSSFLVVAASSDVVTTSETIVSYLAFMAALAAFAGGAFLWVRNR